MPSKQCRCALVVSLAVFVVFSTAEIERVGAASCNADIVTEAGALRSSGYGNNKREDPQRDRPHGFEDEELSSEQYIIRDEVNVGGDRQGDVHACGCHDKHLPRGDEPMGLPDSEQVEKRSHANARAEGGEVDYSERHVKSGANQKDDTMHESTFNEDLPHGGEFHCGETFPHACESNFDHEYLKQSHGDDLREGHADAAYAGGRHYGKRRSLPSDSQGSDSHDSHFHGHHSSGSHTLGNHAPGSHAHGSHAHGSHCSCGSDLDHELACDPGAVSFACVRLKSVNCMRRLSTGVVSHVSTCSVSKAAYLSSLSTAMASFAGVMLLPLPPAASGVAAVAFLSFASGALLADTTLHLLPHAFERDPHQAGYAVMTGIAVFFVLDRILASFTSHSHGRRTGVAVHSYDAGMDSVGENRSPSNGDRAVSAAWLSLCADAVHNFCDGLSIGASYKVSSAAGVSTTLAVFLHEVPQELGDFMLLLRGGWSRPAALLANLVCAMSALVGTAASLRFGAAWDSKLLPFCAGGLVFMAIGSILPELGDAISGCRKSSADGGPGDRAVLQKVFRCLVATVFCITGVGIVQMIESTAHGSFDHAH